MSSFALNLTVGTTSVSFNLDQIALVSLGKVAYTTNGKATWPKCTVLLFPKENQNGAPMNLVLKES